jgi:hypothetical protein
MPGPRTGKVPAEYRAKLPGYGDSKPLDESGLGLDLNTTSRAVPPLASSAASSAADELMWGDCHPTPALDRRVPGAGARSMARDFTTAAVMVHRFPLIAAGEPGEIRSRAGDPYDPTTPRPRRS